MADIRSHPIGVTVDMEAAAEIHPVNILETLNAVPGWPQAAARILDRGVRATEARQASLQAWNVEKTAWRAFRGEVRQRWHDHFNLWLRYVSSGLILNLLSSFGTAGLREETRKGLVPLAFRNFAQAICSAMLKVSLGPALPVWKAWLGLDGVPVAAAVVEGHVNIVSEETFDDVLFYATWDEIDALSIHLSRRQVIELQRRRRALIQERRERPDVWWQLHVHRHWFHILIGVVHPLFWAVLTGYCTILVFRFPEVRAKHWYDYFRAAGSVVAQRWTDNLFTYNFEVLNGKLPQPPEQPV